MDKKIHLIAACPPEYIRPASSKGLHCAHMCYKICRDGRLYIMENADPRGGIMAIDCHEPCDRHTHHSLSESIIRECEKRSFSGIFLDIPERIPVLSELASVICDTAAKIGICVFIPFCAADSRRGAKVVISSAVSAGTYEGLLSSAINKFGADNLAIEIQLIRAEFALPDRSGKGRELTQRELKNLHTSYGRNAFFSKELCAYYFTYTRNGKAHFVLYENSRSIKQKLSIAEKMGITTAFAYYPDFTGILF